MKYRLSAVASVVTLNRASRNAAHAIQRKAASHARTGHPGSAQVWTRTAGATPKEIRSASESSWMPNGEVAPTARATAPSAMSITMLTAIKMAASRCIPRKASSTHVSPAIMFSVVKMLGATTRRRSL